MSMREKMVKLAKQAVKLLAIELFVPGGDAGGPRNPADAGSGVLDVGQTGRAGPDLLARPEGGRPP